MATSARLKANDAHTKRKRERSPNYPQIGFRTALEHARKIYDADKRHPMRQELAAKHLGYAGLTGRSIPVLSALRKFGLLEPTDDGHVRISNEAHAVFVMPSDDPDRAELIRKLAFRPPIFQELFSEFRIGSGGLPSDANLQTHLQLKRGFIAEAAASLIASLKETIEVLGSATAGAEPSGTEEAAPSEQPSVGVGSPRDPIAKPSAPSPLQTSTPVAPGVDVQVWSLGDGIKAEFRITGKLGPRHIRKLRGFIDVFLSDSDEQDSQQGSSGEQQ